MNYYEKFKPEAEKKCKALYTTASGLKKQLPKVRKRLKAETVNRDKLRKRIERLQELSVESLAGDANSYEKYKISMKKLNSELAVSVEIITNIETTILPNAEAKLKDAETNLRILLNQTVLESRKTCDEVINELLRNCLRERQAFLDSFYKLFQDYGSVFVCSDEAFAPGPFNSMEVRDMKLRLGMDVPDEPGCSTATKLQKADEPPRPAKPLDDIYGDGESPESDDLVPTGNNAPNGDDICEKKNSETEKISLAT
jgi:hypothetical protein